MSDAALLEAVRLVVRAEVERALAPLLRDTLTPMQRRVLRAVAAVYAADEVFTTSELVDTAGAAFGQRAALRLALQQACALDVRRVGILLRQVADAGGVVDDVRLVALPAAAGSRRWALQGIDSR